jgi:hypothetical protein
VHEPSLINTTQLSDCCGAILFVDDEGVACNACGMEIDDYYGAWIRPPTDEDDIA